MYKISVKNEVKQTYLVFRLSLQTLRLWYCHGNKQFQFTFGSCESLKVICSEVYVLLKWSLFSETLGKNDGAQG